MSTSTRGLPRKEPKTISRITKSGRKLTYALTVIQQPARARACGSGAKSSADRRPVDPPPVVELRVFEDKPGQERQDITFAYTANFFLFATLENARPMAHGRLQQAPTPTVPVLTGMPVSGMAYLDRPEEAGYFIFPDLSVRHEGTYKLSFNLYEETKEDEDRDAETTEQKPNPLGGQADASFDWRLEIKSDDFVVYSAKKFPGLAESTSLSRTVAEQGCRVRIRRDVRMRRREEKPSAFEEPSEEEYNRSRAMEQGERERSRSNSGTPDRRVYDPRQNNNSYSGSPSSWGNGTPHPPPPGPQGYLGFAPQGSEQYQPPAQPQFAQPQPPTQNYPQNGPPAPYQSYATGYRQQPPPPPPPPPQQAPSSYGGHEQPYPQTAYPSNPPRERPLEIETNDFNRRNSAPYPPAPQHAHYNPPPIDTGYLSRPYEFGHNSEKPGLAPLKNALGAQN